jgi:hypothetical protein
VLVTGTLSAPCTAASTIYQFTFAIACISLQGFPFLSFCHALRVQSVGDINGDKMDYLILHNSAKQYMIYGNKERKFDPVEWVHK